MPHNIFDNRFASLRKPAWHGLGTVFQEPLSATQALELAKLDISFDTTPIWITTPSEASSDHRFDPQPHPTQVQLWRVDPHNDTQREAPVAIVGKDYTWMDNTDIARMIEPLTEHWPVETVGALANGEHLFFTLKAGVSDIGGDELRDFFVIHDHRDGSSGLEVMFTPVRVVCQNTLVASIDSATTRISVRHDRDFKANAALYTELMANMRGIRAQVYSSFRNLAQRKITLTTLDTVLGKVYRDPRPSDAHNLLLRAKEEGQAGGDIVARLETMKAELEQKRQWAKHSRDQVLELTVKIGDEYPRIAGTAWALYNAVVEFEDFGRIQRKGSGSAIFGERADRKTRAFELLAKV